MTMTAGTEMSGSRSCWTWVAAKMPATEEQHHSEHDDDAKSK